MSTGIVQEAKDHPEFHISTTKISDPNYPVKFVPTWDPIFETAFGVEDDIALWTNLGLMRHSPAVDLIECIKINTETEEVSSLNNEAKNLTYSDFEKGAGKTYHTLKPHIKIQFIKGGKVLQYDYTTPVALRGGGGMGGRTIPIDGTFFGIPEEIMGGGRRKSGRKSRRRRVNRKKRTIRRRR